jgi:hypothetical protein
MTIMIIKTLTTVLRTTNQERATTIMPTLDLVLLIMA